jgi:small subunit ribosomal protein S17
MKIFRGKVLSKKMQKTATVGVELFISHPIYKKRYKKIKKYHVHDDFDVKVGEKVAFVDSRPYSKLVRWKIIDLSKKNLKPKKRKEK